MLNVSSRFDGKKWTGRQAQIMTSPPRSSPPKLEYVAEAWRPAHGAGGVLQAAPHVRIYDSFSIFAELVHRHRSGPETLAELENHLYM